MVSFCASQIKSNCNRWRRKVSFTVNSANNYASKSSSDDEKQNVPVAPAAVAAPAGSSYSIPLGYVTDYLSSLFTSTKAATTTVAKITTTKPVIKRKPVVSRDALREKTRALAMKLQTANTSSSQLLRIEELRRHLLNHPESSSTALKGGVAPLLWKWRRRTQDQELVGQIGECLALLGHVAPPQGRGIRLLSIDGGGTRGLAALEILDALEQLCPGYRINQLFDYIVGVSTGALIAAMIGGLQLTIPQCKKIYREISVNITFFYKSLLIHKIMFAMATNCI